MKKAVILKKASQAFFSLLFICILWSAAHPLKGIFPPRIFFVSDPLIMLVTSISERTVLEGIIFSISMLVLTLILGRFFCGWVCPLGAAVDMMPGRARGAAASPKFFILGAMFLVSLFGIQSAWFFDPIVIAARFVSLNLIPAVTLGLDRFFVFMIKAAGMHGPLLDLYRALKASVLGVNTYYFSHSGAIMLFFVVVAGSSLFVRRFWCRSVCPLGALYSLFARFALLRRVVRECKECRRCKSLCRMGAIRDDGSYSKGECVLCMDCIYDCPQSTTRFEWPR